MSAKDDDSTLTQLATAWVDMYLGGAKVKEAFAIFQERGAKYNWTVSLSRAPGPVIDAVPGFKVFTSCNGRAPHALGHQLAQ